MASWAKQTHSEYRLTSLASTTTGKGFERWLRRGLPGFDPMTDLVDRARRGEGAAFDALYEKNAGRVFAICVRLTADPMWAEELTQDVFVRAWQRIESFRGESRFSSWLYRLAINVVVDAQRRRGREKARFESLADVCTPHTTDGGAWNLDLERAVARLPVRARTALVLYAIEGYKYDEIADMMDIAIGTVKAHISHARKQLLQDLDR